MERKIITIGRQYGSGGREIGHTLGKVLNIPVYDKELLDLASEKSGMSREYLEKLDEQGTASFFQSLVFNATLIGNVATNYYIPMNDQLFILQSEMIVELATKSDCIIIGRCADDVLKDKFKLIKVFITGNLECRIKKVMERHNKTCEEAKQEVAKIDKKRASYYDYYTRQSWQNISNYDISLNSSKFSINEIVDILAALYRK